MKHLFFTLALLVAHGVQAQNPAIILAPKYTYNDAVPISLPVPSSSAPTYNDPNDPTDYYDGQVAKQAQNIQVDKQGRIMFFIVDGYVFDRKGKNIGLLNENPNYNGVIGETMIIPDPNCDNKNSYILISSYITSSGGVAPIEPIYDKLVVSYDGNDDLLPGSGLLSTLLSTTSSFNQPDFFIKNIIGPTIYAYSHGDDATHGNTPYFAASKVLSSNKRFVYLLNGIGIFRLKVENNNLTYDNYFLDLSTFSSDIKTNELGVRGEMEMVTLPNGNLRLGFSIGSDNNYDKSFAVLDLNSSTGNYITGTLKHFGYNTQTGVNLFSKGIEFSPDGSKLYVTHNSTTQYPSTLDYFDLSTSTPTRTALSTLTDFKDSQIESGDGFLLIPATSQLYKINNPNSSSPTISNYIALSGYAATSPFTPSLSGPADYVRLMQDQIDGENYSAYVNTPAGVTVSSYTATTNATWTAGGLSNNPFNATNGVVTIQNELIIPAGKTITISGMTFQFAPNARLIIENGVGTQLGGKLILNGTTLTAASSCGTSSMWRGVEVRGNTTATQVGLNSMSQGRIEIKNDSRIEHATQGVSALKYTKIPFYSSYLFLPDYNRTGGVIIAENSTFFNNYTDVLLTDYLTTYSSSRFTNCFFKTSGVLNIPYSYVKHISLNKIRGVNILGCVFINENWNAIEYPLSNRGMGIYAVNANFNAKSNCLFENLTYGIYHTSTDATDNFNAKGNRFINNEIGINVQGSNLFNIDDNYFEVLRVLPYFGQTTWQTAGIYLNGTDGYRVEGNNLTFGYSADGSSESRAYGIVVKKSGVEHNEIYRNVMDGLYVGGQSENINGSQNANNNDPLARGLQWKCNVFKNIVKHDLTVVQGRIDYHQGYAGGSDIANTRLHAARNTFSLMEENMNLVHDIKMDQATQYLEYVHLSGDQVCDSYTPDGTINGVNPHPQTFNAIAVAPGTNDCPVQNLFLKPVVLSGYQFAIGGFKSAKDNLEASNPSDPSYGKLINEFAFANSQKTKAWNDLNSLFLSDSSLNAKTDYINFLKEDEEIASKRQLLELFFIDSNYQSVTDLLDSVNFGKEYKSFIELAMNFPRLDSMENYLELNPSVKEDLINLSLQEKDVLTAHKASLILNYNPKSILEWAFLELSEERSSNAPLSAENSNESSGFKLFPNPANSSIRLQTISAEKVNAHILIFDITGKVVDTKSMNRAELFIDIQVLENGIYLIQITNIDTNEIETIRFVKH